MKTAIFLLAGAVTFSIACGPVEAPVEAVDLDEVKAELIEADNAWAADYAAAENKADAFVTRVEDGIRFLAPDMPLAEGKDATHGAIEQIDSMPGFEITWTANAADVSAGGDFGYTMGTYVMTMDGPDGAPVRIDGKYITLWRKQEDGSWKVAADVFNANGPPTPIEE